MVGEQLPVTLAELDVAAACLLLAQGRAVAFPTDCGYGFALDPFHPEAEVAMAQLKPGRDAPVGLIAADRSQVDPLVHRWTPIAERCAALWPAELTLVFVAAPGLPAMVVSTVGGVAVRVPARSQTRALAAHYGGPLTATSLNRSGQPPARRPDELEAFGGLIAGYLAGETGDEPPSTLVDVSEEAATILRHGSVSLPWR